MFNSNFTKPFPSHKKSQYSLDFRSPKQNNATDGLLPQRYKSPFRYDHPLQDNNDDTNKENQNNSNIPSRKENRKNSDSFNLILKETNFLSSNIYKYKSKTPTILKNPCSSPKFLGGLTSPSGQGLNIPKGNTTNLLHEEYALETRIRPYKGEMDLKFQNARNRYSNTKTNNIHMVNKSKRYENKPAETLSLRKSMSLEDLRLAQKAEPENKGSSRNTHEAKKLGWAFSFNNKSETSHEQNIKEKLEKRQEFNDYRENDEDFLSNIKGYIHHFDEGERDMKSYGVEREAHKKENKESSYQALLRQFRASNEEISTLKTQLEELSEKKDTLITTNNLILQELEKHYQREKVLRNKLNILEGQIIELRSESKYYKEKYKEAQRQYKEERIGNENDLLHLKKILSENINIAFGNKTNQSWLNSTAKSKYAFQDSFNSMMVPSSIRKETKVSMDKNRGPKQTYRPHKERIGSFSIKREDPDKLRYKKSGENFHQNYKLNVSSASSEEYNEMSQHQAQDNKLKNTREEDFEDLEEIKETFRKGSMSKENKEEILGSTSRNSAIQKGLEKEKHIQVLQKKLAKLLQNNDPAILSQSKLGKSQCQSNIKYSTNNHEYDDSNEISKQSNFMRRHAGTFIETPISEDIHECSFSLPTSE